MLTDMADSLATKNDKNLEKLLERRFYERIKPKLSGIPGGVRGKT